MENLIYIKSKNSLLYCRKKTEIIHPSISTRIILPADPLLKRKIIPFNSPRIGKMKRYLLLPSFNTNETYTRFEYKTQLPDKFYLIQEKQYELDAYINSGALTSKLIYLKTKLNKEGKISLENILNLKKTFYSTEKKYDHNLEPYYKKENNQDRTLIFESRFECGNLLCAFKSNESTNTIGQPLPNINSISNAISIPKYQLILQNDTNTTGYIQWFFYSVKNTTKGQKVMFSMINLLRKKCLYSNGLKIWCYSEKKAEKDNKGWSREGENVMYYPNNLYIFNRDRKRTLYTMSFEYEFQYDNDTVYFANSLPFLYTDVMKELNNYQLEEAKFPYFQRKTLCSTLGGNDLDMFTINTMDNHLMNCNCENDHRKGIILMARQHPGETCSSYVMKGAMDFLLGPSNEAKKLRELYLIRVIPMMNPDGVIAGNSRTSFAGCDINRRWKTPHEVIHPEIYRTKEMILRMSSQREISFICDFHGHFNAYNSFFYCNHKENRKTCSLFPFICSKINSLISFSQSNYKMPKYKSGTGRISLFNELGINNIVTLETSFFGANRLGEYHHVYFNSKILKEIGRDVCLGMLSYYYKYENKSIERSLSKIDVDIKDFDDEVNKNEENDKENSDSESEPSLDNFDPDKISSLLPTKIKSKKKKKKKMTHSTRSLNASSSKKFIKEEIIAKPIEAAISTPIKPNYFTSTISSKTIIPFKERKTLSNPKIATIISPVPKILSNTIIVFDKQHYERKKLQTDHETQTEPVFFNKPWMHFAGDFRIFQRRSYKENNHRLLEMSSIRNNSFNSYIPFNNPKQKNPLIYSNSNYYQGQKFYRNQSNDSHFIKR